MRLKSDFEIPENADSGIKVILQAMKDYGVVIADTGGDMFLSGTHDDRWDDDTLGALKQLVHAGDFEALYTGGIIPY